jgi:flagellar biosynthesis protein FlhG
MANIYGKFPGSDPSPRSDQAERLRELMTGQSASPAPGESGTHIISVTSGKGGVGKTFVAANLSIALAARGHRVVLFDMDLGLANADIVLGVDAVGTWSDVLAGRRTIDDVIVQGPGQIAFVPGASGIAEVADLSEFERHRLLRAMQRIQQDYDVAVLDCGAGISQNVTAFAASADTILVVAAPEPTALTDAYATIKVFAQMTASVGRGTRDIGSVGVVVNQAHSKREAKSTFERLAGVSARFLHLPVADYGYILQDDHVSMAVRQRSPVILRYPRSSAGACLMSVAGKLSREIGQPEAQNGLFYRVMNMFL